MNKVGKRFVPVLSTLACSLISFSHQDPKRAGLEPCRYNARSTVVICRSRRGLSTASNARSMLERAQSRKIGRADGRPFSDPDEKRRLALVAAGWPQARSAQGQPLTTKEHVLSAGWWPTKSAPQRAEYSGPESCVECHPSEAAMQQTTPMAKACALATDSKALATHEHLGFRLGSYVYDLTRSGGRSVLSVGDGTRSVSAVLGWAFGEGEVGETYVFVRGGTFYEGRLSYFPVLQALDITPGQQRSIPSDIDRALGRPLEAEETRLCFGCHNTASSTAGRFDPSDLILGVTCEACHGPGARHVAAMKAGRTAEGLAHVLNPAKLHPVDSADFCGACHRTWADVMESGMEGVATIRFQPYRLELSRCWEKGDDPRITCIACHDPHRPLTRDLSSYDNLCLRCHLATEGSKRTSDHPGSACPRSTKDCVTCHMPKYEVPGTHTKFTDHRISIVVGSGTGAVAGSKSAAPSLVRATSHVACGFPALRVPARFTARVMGRIGSGRRYCLANLR